MPGWGPAHLTARASLVLLVDGDVDMGIPKRDAARNNNGIEALSTNIHRTAVFLFGSGAITIVKVWRTPL